MRYCRGCTERRRRKQVTEIPLVPKFDEYGNHRYGEQYLHQKENPAKDSIRGVILSSATITAGRVER